MKLKNRERNNNGARTYSKIMNSSKHFGSNQKDQIIVPITNIKNVDKIRKSI
jgi:hypothetical protein